jgi:hypothetical protein
MKVRSILFESSSMYVRSWLRLVPLAVALSFALAVAALVAGSWAPLVSTVLTVPVVFVLQAMHVVESAETRAGAAGSAADAFRHVRSRLKPLLAAVGLTVAKLALLLAAFAWAVNSAVVDQSIGELVGSVIAFLFFYLYLTTRWSMVTPVIVLEEVGAWRAFGRSRRLVRGHGVRVFVVLLAAQVVVAIASVVIAYAVGKGIHGSEDLKKFVREVVSEPLTSPFLVLMWTNAYFALRRERHEPDLVVAAAVPA